MNTIEKVPMCKTEHMHEVARGCHLRIDVINDHRRFRWFKTFTRNDGKFFTRDDIEVLAEMPCDPEDNEQFERVAGMPGDEFVVRITTSD
jgi:hypothetical protein